MSSTSRMRPQGGDYKFAAELTGVKVVLRYDEVTAQAQRLADDRDRHFGYPLHLLLR